MTSIAAARRLAEEQLVGPLPRRWRHVQAVAATANQIAAEVVELDATVLVCAAWLHDIGYAPSLTDTGFHPLDGARFLRRSGWPDEVCDLVAHHSCARIEANERGVARHLAMEFIDRPGPERDALWTADATTGPDGQRLTLDERVREVEQRYGIDDLVALCMRRIRPELEASIRRTQSRADAAAQTALL